MNQLAEKTELNPVPSAQESIANAKALFNGQAIRCKLEKMFNELPDKSRGLVLIAGGLPAKDYQREFSSFDDLELQKIRIGMSYVKQMVVDLDNELGDVRRLKHYQFSSTH
ncbi:phage protein [Vibrio orientalis CIP 102891 = ATCC 33934]|uniref:Phage protein n=1 Tax=Vibrio orientalis CIP 102891 = ATCC 33934 TaxID=675816 RepID=C9QEA4_VIBOR|nr:hypothetical protein [Vibrio orientalis]EEX94377.1 hypothetical protein VIA_001535 [Vibrio orientalis CIP 102891 = ATCC 33934]EGU54077.1 phage protein [Vibrio orientalis CIP 102891 = ATCC 33934]